MMDAEVTAALMALGGVIISALLSLLICLTTNRFNYRQLYAQTISTNRMDWINVWRENISKFLACAEVLRNNGSCNNDELLKLEKDMGEKNNNTYSKKLFWCFGIVIGIIVGLYLLCGLCFKDFQWNFLIVTTGAILLGMCTMICITVMCIKCAIEKTHNKNTCEIDREIIAAALKVDTSIVCQCKCNRNKDCECRRNKK